jgi:hypothetical protein
MVIRLGTKGFLDAIEVEKTVGPIPVQDGIGKEVCWLAESFFGPIRSWTVARLPCDPSLIQTARMQCMGQN